MTTDRKDTCLEGHHSIFLLFWLAKKKSMEPPLNQWFNLYSQHHPETLLLLLSLVLSICFYRLLSFCGFSVILGWNAFFTCFKFQWFFISIIFRTRKNKRRDDFPTQDESALQIYKQTWMYIAACFEQTCVLAPVKWILWFSCTPSVDFSQLFIARQKKSNSFAPPFFSVSFSVDPIVNTAEFSQRRPIYWL